MLKDQDVTLYQAGLVPAAHVHLGLDAKKGVSLLLSGGSLLGRARAMCGILCTCQYAQHASVQMYNGPV